MNAATIANVRTSQAANDGGQGKALTLAFNGGASKAPLLHIEYSFGPDGTPTVDLDDDDSSGAAGRDYATAFVPLGDPVAIADTDIVVADSDSATLVSARVTIVMSRLS